MAKQMLREIKTASQRLQNISHLTGHANKGTALFVCDTGNKSVRGISNAKLFRELASVLYKYAVAVLFRMNHNREEPDVHYHDALAVVDELRLSGCFLYVLGEQTRQKTGGTEN